MSFSEVTLRVLVSVLLYPGLLFLILTGLLAEGWRRKFVARAEGRIGPSLRQPFYDVRKYLGRIAVVPGTTKANDPRLVAKSELTRAGVFGGPLVGVGALVMATVLLPLPGNLWPFFSVRLAGERPLGLDLLGVALLLQIPALVTIILGTIASSIYAQLAASRTAQLLVAYMTPYLAAVFGPAIVLGTLDLKLLAASTSPTMLAVKFGCGFIWLVCQPAQLRTRPLAASRGETLEGVTTNIGGAPLAMYKLMNWVERMAAALLFAALFVPLGASNPAVFIGAVLLDLGLVGVLEGLLSQVRLKDALDFYLRFASVGGAVWLLVLVLLLRA